MKSYQSVNYKNIVPLVSLFVILSLRLNHVGASEEYDASYESPEVVSATDRPHGAKTKRIRGVTVTGVNSVLGKPFFSWGESMGAFNFPTVFAYNEFGTEPFTIDASTPSSAVLATGVSSEYLMLSGVTRDEVKPEWVNVPLRNVPVNTDFAFVQKETLRGVLEAQPMEVAQAEPANHITLGQWMEGSGVAKISCFDDGAEFTLRAKSLIPNRMYSVWATMGLEHSGGSSVPRVFPIPLGGTPNVFLTDENGDAYYERVINICPFESESVGSSMLFIDVYYHANHQNYGAVVAPGFIPGNWVGVITFSHLQFPVNVEILED